MARADADQGLGPALQAALAAAGRKPDSLVISAAVQEGLLSLLQCLQAAYAEAGFQSELEQLRRSSRGDDKALLMAMVPLTTRVQDPIFQRFGMPAGSRGVVVMKSAVKAASKSNPRMKELAGDLRELLGLEREEVPFQFGAREDPWDKQAAAYRKTAAQRLATVRQRLTVSDASTAIPDVPEAEQEGSADAWLPGGVSTFFPSVDAVVTEKTPMGRPPDVFQGALGRAAPYEFGSPEQWICDRYEMNLWLARSIWRYGGAALGEAAITRLFEGEAHQLPQQKDQLRAIYLAGVEGTGHHGFGPLLNFPMVCQYGDGVLSWWRSLREVLMKTPPTRRRLRLRRILSLAATARRPQLLFEAASWPFGEEARERWAAGCEDPEALPREERSGNPGNSVDLAEFVQLMGEHGDVKVLVLHRGLVAAAWSHKEWDEGLLEHARILALFNDYLTKVLGSLDPRAWRWVAYERVCEAHRQGELSALDPVADFLGLERLALKRSFEHFRPSTKDAAKEMPPHLLEEVRSVEARRAADWFPARFPGQELRVATG